MQRMQFQALHHQAGRARGLKPESEAVVAMEMQAGGGTTVAQVASHPLPRQTSALPLITLMHLTQALHTPTKYIAHS